MKYEGQGGQGVSEEQFGVFLCHGKEDKEHAINLYGTLKEIGYRPWLDKFDLLPGADWKAAIEKSVKESDAVLVLLSTSSVRRRGFLQREISLALDVAAEVPEGDTFVIPIRLDECNVPDRLAKYQWVDFWDPTAHDLLFASLHAQRERKLGTGASRLAAIKDGAPQEPLTGRLPVNLAMLRHATPADVAAVFGSETLESEISGYIDQMPGKFREYDLGPECSYCLTRFYKEQLVMVQLTLNQQFLSAVDALEAYGFAIRNIVPSIVAPGATRWKGEDRGETYLQIIAAKSWIDVSGFDLVQVEWPRP